MSRTIYGLFIKMGEQDLNPRATNWWTGSDNWPESIAWSACFPDPVERPWTPGKILWLSVTSRDHEFLRFVQELFLHFCLQPPRLPRIFIKPATVPLAKTTSLSQRWNFPSASYIDTGPFLLWLWFTCPSVENSCVHASTRPCIHPPIHPSIHLSIHPSIHPWIYLCVTAASVDWKAIQYCV
jgi:hypothetical protein